MVPLDPEIASLIAASIGDPDGVRVVAWGHCQPNRSTFANSVNIGLLKDETIDEAADRLALWWSPQWLLDAGFSALDSGGQVLDTACVAASSAGPISWRPDIHLARVDDQVPNSTAPSKPAYRRRLAGEVAVLAMWEAARVSRNLPDLRPAADVDGNTRGAQFRDLLMETIRRSLPSDWSVRHEVPLTEIRGLHMRKNVGERKSDIVVTDAGGRLVAVISSKWTWRSDRGSEAAQIVPLRMYRPDVPYALATAEFARVRVVARESIEDSVYHLCPDWAGAWYAVTRTTEARTRFPTLEDLLQAGRNAADALGLEGIDALARALRSIGTIL